MGANVAFVGRIMVDMYGKSKVNCTVCGKNWILKGWLPTTRTIWYRNEGLKCCKIQTQILWQEGNEE